MLKGRNFGNAGNSLDLRLTEFECNFLKSVINSIAGPDPWRSVTFCSPQWITASVYLNKNENDKYVDYSKDFTILLWVKTTQVDLQTLVGSSPRSATRFSFWPTPHQLSLLHSHLNWQQGAISTVDTRGYSDWRHLVVVSRAPNKVKFFRNGEIWQMKQKMPPNRKLIQADYLLMFGAGAGVMNTKGLFGQVMVFQRALPDSEVRQIFVGEV